MASQPPKMADLRTQLQTGLSDRYALERELGQGGMATVFLSQDVRHERKIARNGPYIRHQLARIYLLVGEPDKALDQLEALLKIPYFLSPGWLRVDPTFASVQDDPRFGRLVAAR